VAGARALFEGRVAWDGVPAVQAGGELPLDAAELLREPARALRRLPAARLEARVAVPSFPLARLAGRAGLPKDLAGTLAGDGALRGTLRQPRGEIGLDALGLQAFGYRDAELHAVVALGDGVTAFAARAALGGGEVAQANAAVYVAAEDLADRAILDRAPFDLDVVVPEADLGRFGGRVPLAGRVRGRLVASGKLAAVRVEASLHGDAVRLQDRPLGDVDAVARASHGRITASAKLAVASGGTLDAALEARSELGLAAVRSGALGDAPATLTVTADRVDLGFLPALAPGTVRSASGELGADLAAKGPLRRLRPQGSVRLAGGRLAIAELGEWTGIEVDAALSEDALRVTRLEARRGAGRLRATAEATGIALRDGPGRLAARVTATDLTIPRAGQDVITLGDLEATADGTFTADVLKAEVRVPKGELRLPKRLPREVQGLERREDIVIGTEKPKRARKHGEPPAPGEDPDPYRVVVHVVVPNRLWVRGTDPRLDVELRADATFDAIGARVYAEGQVEVVRGELEPIGGRRFEIERARLTFTGGAPGDALLDAVARYENPAAVVTVTVSGSTTAPVIKMTSVPPMDEAQIAMLIATGRTELKAGSGGVGTLTGEEAGKAALGAVVTNVFQGVIADKLPVDTIALDSAQIRAGKYLTDKVYVGYTYDLEARPEEGENANEVRLQYQISPRWTFEARAGDAGSGGGSLIWSKDY
jgi:translocation and assembly module TamB